MNQKQDRAKLQILSESNIDHLSTEVKRIVWLYQAGRINGEKAHRMLHDANKDLHEIFWNITTRIGKAHGSINTIHHVRKSGEIWPDGRGYLSKQTAQAIDTMLLCSKLVRNGLSDYTRLKKTAIIVKHLMKRDVKTLCTDINDLLYQARNHKPVPTNNEPEIFEEVELKDMQVKKVAAE